MQCYSICTKYLMFSHHICAAAVVTFYFWAGCGSFLWCAGEFAIAVVFSAFSQFSSLHSFPSEVPGNPWSFSCYLIYSSKYSTVCRHITADIKNTTCVTDISRCVFLLLLYGFFRVFWSRLLSLRTVWISLRRQLTGDDANSPAHGWEPDLSWTVLSSLNFSLAHWVCIAIFCVSVQYVRVQRRKLKSPPPAYSPSFSGQLKGFKKYKFSILAWHHMISVWLYQWSFM